MSETVINRNLTCKYYLVKGESTHSYEAKLQNLSNAHLLFYYYKPLKCYIIWNSTIPLIMYKNCTKTNFSFTSLIHRLLLSGNEITDIKSFDKKIINKVYKNVFEKNVIVPECKLLDFCQNYENYIYPSEEDLKHRQYLFALPNDSQIKELTSNSDSYMKVSREREKLSRLRRNPAFRDIILRKYNYTCVICGCKEQSILEAAHIKGVAEGGDDSENNGICLCKNHHGLYDAGLLHIDLINGFFECTSDQEKNMPWYINAQERNCSLFCK